MIAGAACFMLVFATVAGTRAGASLWTFGALLSVAITILVVAAVAYVARRPVAQRRGFLMLSADAAGVWIGRFAQRTDWSELLAIKVSTNSYTGDREMRFVRSRAALGGKHSPVGRAIGRMIRDRVLSLSQVATSEDDIIAGLRVCAQAAGYQLVAKDTAGTYEVRPR